jgi:uncharacterized damage-inducible protein DinB
MNIPKIYDYLIRTRRDLWATLEGVPDEILSRPLAGEAWFPCLKDLVFHIATVEDGWLNMDILRRDPVLENFPTLRNAKNNAVWLYTQDDSGLLAGCGKEYARVSRHADR